MSDSANQILNSMTFERSDYDFSKSKINRSGGKSVNVVSNSTKTYLALSTPLMLTWGVNEFVDDATGRKSYDMSLQFPKDEYATPETSAFLDKMISFENSVKEHVKNNSKELLNKARVSDDVVEALFHPMLRYPKDPNTGEPDMTRAPTLRIKINFWENSFDCEIYNMESQTLFPNEDGISPQDLIPKGINLATVIRCGGLWFANGKFGVTWRLVQAMVKPRATLKGKCFIQLSQADKSRLESQSDHVDDDPDVSSGQVSMEIAEDSDDDDVSTSVTNEVASSISKPDSEPSADTTPTPAKKVVKKVKRVVKKKTSASTN